MLLQSYDFFEIAVAQLPYTNPGPMFVVIIGYDASAANAPQTFLVKDQAGAVVMRFGRVAALVNITVVARSLTINSKTGRFTFQNASLNAPTYLDLNTTADDAGTIGTIGGATDQTTYPYWAECKHILLPPKYQVSQTSNTVGMMAVQCANLELAVAIL